VPKSQMVIELVGLEAPSANAAPIKLEARASPRQVARFKATAKEDLHLLYDISVSRATTNMTAISMFYTDILKAKLTHTVDEGEVSRRCYQWGTAKSDVCFVQRPDTTDAGFTTADFERMMWATHATNLLKPADGDKYNDNHFAADLQISGDYIVTFMDSHDPYPIGPTSWWAYACFQSYLIDPTGW
jgi:hypothetical protein